MGVVEMNVICMVIFYVNVFENNLFIFIVYGVFVGIRVMLDYWFGLGYDGDVLVFVYGVGCVGLLVVVGLGFIVCEVLIVDVNCVYLCLVEECILLECWVVVVLLEFVLYDYWLGIVFFLCVIGFVICIFNVDMIGC